MIEVVHLGNLPVSQNTKSNYLIVVKEAKLYTDGVKKYITVRYQNRFREVCDSLTIKLSMFDSKGAKIGESKYQYKNIVLREQSTTETQEPIEIDNNTARVEIVVKCANFLTIAWKNDNVQDILNDRNDKQELNDSYETVIKEYNGSKTINGMSILIFILGILLYAAIILLLLKTKVGVKIGFYK